MTEELPTVEKIKAINHTTFRDWKCCLCETDDETFSHLWLCDEVTDEIMILVDRCQTQLLYLVNQYRFDKNTVYSNINQLIPSEIWNCQDDDTTLTLLDLIKGFIPLSWNGLLIAVKTQKQLLRLVYDFHLFLLQETEKIWLHRCVMQHEKERLNNITHSDRCSDDSLNNNYIDLYRKIDTDNRFNLEALEEYGRTGMQVLRFYDTDSC